ncbi:MBL fold metallo-hydrolase [Jannaschia rubra]|uniref:Metallo-beta-lactamase superfamily protein n=1 Tax=Jannaschia rubra TaxID=282197 RepID=A0A0M6XJI8_9RHOB|nr:MBL fold metallo-hydrolase [Jannaschia rubra]CTQ31360.1 Metallo-beta-lactamase superfamily protein [Jannaschia rubra]SFF81027.1 Glyoxylase, beta-lactamase superfamily II [Jannaschia rubra]
MIDRRTFIASSLAGVALPYFALAQIELADGQSLITVSDGNLVLPRGFIFDPMPKDELASVVAPFDLGEELTPECNLALVQGGGRTILFDAGAGPDFQPSAGHLLAALEAAGIAPADVTDVVFTHAHPDHIWGALDDFDEPLFSEAVHHIGTLEHAYWSDPATLETIGEARATFAVGAARRLEALADRLRFFDDGDEVLSGMLAIASPGHTPGHMSFQIGDTLILGDAIGNHHVAFLKPDWPSGSDQDQDMAAATRRALFDRIRADDLAIVGFHLPQGGYGRVDAEGDGFRFVQS